MACTSPGRRRPILTFDPSVIHNIPECDYSFIILAPLSLHLDLRRALSLYAIQAWKA